MKLIPNIVILIVLTACAKTEESYQMYDSQIYSHFLIALDNDGVDYRVSQKLSIFYPVSERERVKEIADMVIAEYFTGCGATVTSTEMQKKIEAELSKKEIPYRVIKLDNGPRIVCPKEYHSTLSEAILKGLESD